MSRIAERFSPSSMALAWRLLAAALLAALWLRGQAGAEGLVIVLGLAILGLARWRFPRLPAWTLLVDEAAYCGAALLWPEAAYGLAVPVLDALAAGAPLFALPVLVAASALGAWSAPLAATLGAAALGGLSLRLWSGGVEAARREADRDRRERYELEALRSELLAANLRGARMAELAERGRIARDLHDHAGHELTAADLALKAYAKLRESGDPDAEEMLAEASRRVGEGLAVLRTTVRGLAPASPAGLESFEAICSRFAVRRVGLEVHGDSGRIPAYVWAVLEPCLKEALSNAARHGEGRAPAGEASEAAPGARPAAAAAAPPEPIAVALDVGPSIARLSVSSGGPRGQPERRPRAAAVAERGGIGLRNLRQRARAIGGSVSVDEAAGFRLVCVLPIDEPAEVLP